jgi:hypothetical protein
MIKKILIEDDLETLLGWFGYDYDKALKKRIKSTVLISLVLSVFIFAMGNYNLIIPAIILAILFYKTQYWQLKRTKKSTDELKRRMFPSFIKKLLILMRTNNIYTSLLKMKDYTDEPIKGYLLELIEEVNNDKGSDPYVKFANKMGFIEAYQVMIMLYSFAEHSKNKKHLISLEKMISQLYENEIDETIESKKRLLWLYPNYIILTMLAFVFSLAIYMFISIFSEMGLS